AFITLWVILYYNDHDSYAPLTEYSSSVEQERFRKLWIVQEGKRIEFNLRREPGRLVFVGPNNRELPTRPQEIIVKEDGEEAHFKPDRDDRGNFKPDPNSKLLSYRDQKGRVMREAYRVQLVPEKRPGTTFIYMLLNLLPGVVWFVCLWPLLRFTWGQALLLTVGCWLMMTLIILPPILTQARDVAKERARPA